MTEQTYTVKQVAELTGASIRALHHYEDLGLLSPRRHVNGYRAYTSRDLDRLQLVLLYRTCGMKLAEIKRIIDDPAFSSEQALAAHLETLKAQRADIDRLIETVEKTISSIREGTAMTDKEKFDGLKHAAIEANERTYGAEARATWGDEAIDAANEKLLDMNEQDWQTREELEQAIIEQLKVARDTNDPASPQAQELAKMHAQWIRMSWAEGAYSADAHKGLAHMYLADPRFTEYYDSRAGEGATQFLVDALDAYLG